MSKYLLCKNLKTGEITDDVVFEDQGDVKEDMYYISKIIIDGVEYFSKTRKQKTGDMAKKRWNNDMANVEKWGFIMGEINWYGKET